MRATTGSTDCECTDSESPDLRVRLSTDRHGNMTILVTGLTGDEGFEPTDNCYFRTAGSLRWEVERILKLKAHECGIAHRMVNSQRYVGTTAWTFYGTGHANTVRQIAGELAEMFAVQLQVSDFPN